MPVFQKSVQNSLHIFLAIFETSPVTGQVTTDVREGLQSERENYKQERDS